MVTTIRDFLPFGDAGPELFRRVAAERPNLPVEDIGAVFALGKAAVAMFDLIATPLAAEGLSPARWRLLMTLRHQADAHGASIGEIAGHLEIREPTVTATVDRAVEDGLVERTKDVDDRRVTRVVLTPTGHATIERLLPQVVEGLAEVSRSLGGASATAEMAARLAHGVDAATPRRARR